MPELPEVEIAARLIGTAIRGAGVKSAQARSVNTLKSYDPPIGRLSGRPIQGISRRGKYLIVHFEGDLRLLIHLMSAGRLQLYEDEASPSDRTVRLVLTLEDGRQLRLREFGTKQSSWVKLFGSSRDLAEDEALATLGPDAWPDPPPFDGLLHHPRPLYALLRDQRVIAGIGRSWVDEILHESMLSPFKRGDDLNAGQAGELRSAVMEILEAAIDHYEKTISLPMPDKIPMPLKVHRRGGMPCSRCKATLETVHFEDGEMTYCPSCQTGGKVLKDRRLSRLLK